MNQFQERAGQASCLDQQRRSYALPQDSDQGWLRNAAGC